jgi:phospholipid transport system substrate-binding protein
MAYLLNRIPVQVGGGLFLAVTAFISSVMMIFVKSVEHIKSQLSLIVNIRKISLAPFLFLVLLPVALGSDAAAQGADVPSDTEAEIRSMLESRDHKIKDLLGTSKTISDEQKEELRDVINGVVDFRAMGEGALGRHWKGLTAEQQNDFVDTFGQIVRLQSLADLEIYRSSVVYDKITVNGVQAHVMITTTYKKVPTPVEYKLRKNESGWMATDIILDEVSTVKGYARSFQSVIRKKGFDDLMERLENRLEKEKAAQSDA